MLLPHADTYCLCGAALYGPCCNTMALLTVPTLMVPVMTTLSHAIARDIGRPD